MAVKLFNLLGGLATLAAAVIGMAGCGGGDDGGTDVGFRSALASAKGMNVASAHRWQFADQVSQESGQRPQRRLQASAVLSVAPSELFDWAEKTYPTEFPSHQQDQSLSPFVYRYYPESGNYLALNGQAIFVLGPISGGAMLEVGKLADVACLVRPALCNTAPIANAGPAQSVLTGATVKLDGSKSADADQNSLTFAWRFTTKPAGSTAALSDSKAVQPSFVADKPGQYVVELVVNDTLAGSGPATVTITVTDANVPPVANAGSNQSVVVGAYVLLSGTASKDANGDQLSYSWSISSKPAGSAATLGGPNTSVPVFIADKAGTYTVTLVVSDGKASSQPSTVTITAAAANAPPVANAGAAQSVVVGAPVSLSGALSTDANGDLLTYQWAIRTKPAGSIAMLSSSTGIIVALIADTPGTYVISLVVNDGKVSSAPATVTITVVPATSGGGGTSVSVSRLDSNVYFDSSRKLLLLTKFCYEYVYYDKAVLTMTGSTGFYDGKIKFSNGKTCDVDGAYLPSTLNAGNYIVSLTREESDIYLDSNSGSVIWTQYCYQYVYYDNSTLQLTFGGSAYASGARIGTVVFSSKNTCNLIGVFGLAKLN